MMLVTGTASTLHGADLDLTSASWTGHSSAMHGPSLTVTCHAATPSRVHGVCQLVTDMTSGQITLRPAPHMPVNCWQRSQYPSRAASLSRTANPHSGQENLRKRAGAITSSVRLMLGRLVLKAIPRPSPDTAYGSRRLSPQSRRASR
jgi:hypothetical protein